MLHYFRAEDEIERAAGQETRRDVAVDLGDVVDEADRILGVGADVGVPSDFKELSEWLTSTAEIEDPILWRARWQMVNDGLDLLLEERNDELLDRQIGAIDLSLDERGPGHECRGPRPTGVTSRGRTLAR
jgi:hypothetical protein